MSGVNIPILFLIFFDCLPVMTNASIFYCTTLLIIPFAECRDFTMAEKPTYEELERRVKDLEQSEPERKKKGSSPFLILIN